MRSASVAALLLAGSGPAVAQDPGPGEFVPRSAVAIVVARGVDPTQGNAEAVTQGTGFFINSEGLVVTSYHLRTQLGRGVPDENVSYELVLAPYTNARSAKVIYTSPEADVMVLFAPVAGASIKVLKPAYRNAAKINIASTGLFAAGYAAGFDFGVRSGKLVSWSAAINPPVPGWTTDTSYPAGLSGAPVVLEDGRVVALVKGASSDGSATGIVVPISYVPQQYWEASAASAVQASAGDRLIVTANVAATPRTVVKSLELTRDPCDPVAEKTVVLSAEPGWALDASPPTLTMKSFTGSSLISGVRATALGGWEAYAEMTPTGACRQVLSAKVSSGPGARLAATVSYVEQPLPSTRQDVVVANALALDRLSVPLDASATTANLAVTLQKASGETIRLDNRSGDIRTVAGRKSLNLAAIIKRMIRN